MNGLELAQAIEDAIGMLPAQKDYCSCPLLEDSFEECEAGWIAANQMLELVEPGITGNCKAFDEFRSTRKRQYARALWLTLLAHLAEEGALTLEGLK